MADKEITSLTAATTPLAGTELVHISQSGNSRRATLSDVAAIATGAMLKSEYDPDANGIIAVAQGGTNSATASGARTNLGLGTMAVQGAGAVAITGGSVTGITDLTVADGGTGASDASTARTNLGLAIGTDVQAYSANLAGFAATTVANVQNRDNHTGTQLAATISDFSTAADLRIAAAVGVSVQAYDALLDSVSALALSAGDIIYATGPDAVAVLPAGPDGQVLATSGGLPAWDTSLVVGGLLAANNLSDVDDADDALDNLGFGAAGKDISALSLAADVRNYLDTGPYVATRSVMGLLDATKDTASYLTEARREGQFLWTGSSLTSLIVGAVINSSAVNSGTGTITSVAHGLLTGNAVIVTTAVNGLSLNTFYYVIRVDANNFRLATTWANAHAGTIVTLTGTTATTVRRHYDPQQIIYILPPTDYTGASGGWVRIHNGEWHTNWSGANTAFTDASEHLTAMWDLANKLDITLRIVVDRWYAIGRTLPAFTTRSLVLDGTTQGRCGFDKQYVESVGTAGIITAENVGIELRNLYISATSGSGGAGVSAYTTSTTAQSGTLKLKDCRISVGDFCTYTVNVSGASATGSPTGFRSVHIEDSTLFGAASAILRAVGIRHLACSNTLFTLDGGTGTLALLTGGSAVISSNLSFSGVLISGALFLDYCTWANITATSITGNVTITGTCQGVKISSGSIAGNVSFGSGAVDCVVASNVTGTVTYTSGAVRCSVTGSISSTISNPTPSNGCGFPRVAVKTGGTSTARWVQYSDGWYAQHGDIATTAGAASVSFPVAFGSAPEKYGANVRDAQAANSITIATAHEATTSGMSIRAGAITTTPGFALTASNVKWWAEGY